MALALTGLRVWDGQSPSRSQPEWTIRIEDGRIEAIGPEAELAHNAKGIPLSGGTALPGLIDAHIHLTLDPALRDPSDQLAVPPAELVPAMESRARRMVCAGITTARDLGGGQWLELEVRDRILRRETPGPRLLCAGQPLTSPRGHCHFWGGEVGEAADIEAVIQRQLDRGADWIKVMATGGVMTKGTKPLEPQFEQQTLDEIVRRAGASHRAVAAHCHGTVGIDRAARAGVRTIEHCSFAGSKGFGSDFDPAVLEQIASRKGQLWVSPTVNAGWGRRLEREGRTTGFGQQMQRVLRGLDRAGVPMIASTDAGIPGVEHHRLPEALVVMARLAGLSPHAVLRAATSESARALGIADLTGTLEPGRSADVLVVAGNPLEDLTLLQRPRLVVARGEVVFASQSAAGLRRSSTDSSPGTPTRSGKP